jgi:hypothetical protein
MMCLTVFCKMHQSISNNIYPKSATLDSIDIENPYGMRRLSPAHTTSSRLLLQAFKEPLAALHLVAELRISSRRI